MMTKDGGQRIATSTGAILADASVMQGTSDIPLHMLFDPLFWSARGELAEVSAGRGAAWYVGTNGQWVLRHYRRGGWIARVTADSYAWCGERRVRSFGEWRLLAELKRRGLPVPKPLAAGYRRAGALYRCDIITQRIPDARPMSAVLAAAPLDEATWTAVGAAVARMHAAGADHADLNAHNILIGGGVSIIDFDRGRLREPGAWTARNLVRLKRSLLKISRSLPPDRFPAAAWRWLCAGYAAV
jgi:3-deoxy-D-manno-octulosonic acid kinase